MTHAHSTSRPFDGCAYEHNPAVRGAATAGGEPKPGPQPDPPKPAPDEPMPLPRYAGVHGATMAGGEQGGRDPAPAGTPAPPQQPDDGEAKQDDPAPLPQTEGVAARAPFTGWPILH